VRVCVQVRASVGPDFPIMIDCYMSLTVPYTIELARRIEKEVPNGVKWIEEYLPPDDYEGYAEVKAAVKTTLLTTGEHEYTRYGYRQLLERKCADVLQVIYDSRSCFTETHHFAVPL
jgi:L-rhamnonate dehydratase